MTDAITYLDNNATTRVDPRVVEAMLPLFSERYGNPSSAHHFGAQVAVEVEEARRHVAQLIGARDSEIVFTSGGTEADNAALRGVLAARPDKRHIVISAVEHHAIFETAEQLEHKGVEVTQIGVDGEGRLDLDGLAAALRDDTALVSVMLANNETGVIFPLAEVTRVAKQRGVPVHTDAVNAAGKMPISVDDLGVDLVSLSSHKIYGPMGVGALCIRRGTPFRPLIIGGPQERQRRGGTLNAPGIVGFGKACEILTQEGSAERERVSKLRERLEAGLTSRFSEVQVLGCETERLPNTSCVCFPGVAAEPLLISLSEAGICVSTGSACSSGSLDPSHVLSAMGIDPHVAQGQVRFSLGRFNTEQDIDRLFELLPEVISRVAAANLG
jgi:cysteine desulfurase